MFEKFTERARKVMSIARQEAQRLKSEVIGCEHILLGIISEGGGVAYKVFKLTGVDPGLIKSDVEKAIVIPPHDILTLGQIPFSPRSKRVIELAGEAASQMGDDVIGTEHLLLGLMKENESIPATVLQRLGFRIDAVRDMIVQLLKEARPKTDLTKEMEISGTITDTRGATFTVLSRNGDRHEVLMKQLGIEEREITVGRRIQVKIQTQVKFLD